MSESGFEVVEGCVIPLVLAESIVDGHELLKRRPRCFQIGRGRVIAAARQNKAWLDVAAAALDGLVEAVERFFAHVIP